MNKCFVAQVAFTCMITGCCSVNVNICVIGTTGDACECQTVHHSLGVGTEQSLLAFSVAVSSEKQATKSPMHSLWWSILD